MLQVANDNERCWDVVDEDYCIRGHVYAYTFESALREADMWYPGHNGVY